VAKHGSVASVDQEHLARTESPALDDLRRRHGDDAGLRGGGAEAVACALPSKRSQSIAVERRAHHDAIAERERGRAVPGLEPNRLVAIEVADRRGEVATPFPCIRD